MRYRRYYVTSKSDGSVRVVSHGPIVALGRLIFPFFYLLLIIGFFVNLFQGYWQTAGVFILVIGICTPNLAKRRKAAAKDASKP